MREFVNPQERKQRTELFLKEKGITVNEDLGVIDSSKEITIKSKAEICKRLKSAVIMLVHAPSCGTFKFNKSRIKASEMIKEIDAEHLLDNIELNLLKKGCPKKFAGMVFWNTEALVSICWALGLIKDEDMISTKLAGNDLMEIQAKACDMSLDEMIEKNTIRDVEDILDMLDLYFRYHWVLVEKEYGSNSDEIQTGDLNIDVVIERRKALEWLISDIDDWSKIRMDT